MPLTLTASDRTALIRLASTMPVGSEERRAILGSLQKVGARDPVEDLADKIERKMSPGYGRPSDRNETTGGPGTEIEMYWTHNTRNDLYTEVSGQNGRAKAYVRGDGYTDARKVVQALEDWAAELDEEGGRGASLAGLKTASRYTEELQDGMVLRALKDVSVGYPVASGMGSRGLLTKGSLVELSYATNRGDVFASLKSGDVGMETQDGKLVSPPSEDFTLDGGHQTRWPRDWGVVDPRVWEVV